ncbi:MAG: flagellar protein [Lachnospiraceae bacterium]|nr:flagellar protein [Lachnospiraceae bacterium]
MDINNRYSSIDQIAGRYILPQNQNNSNIPRDGISFEDILNQKKFGEIKFSKHAGERLATRNINLTDEQLSRLNEGTKLAEEKGIKESLMIMDKMAFIVNIPNNTVVTALDTEATLNNVFTNIDGAVII